MTKKIAALTAALAVGLLLSPPASGDTSVKAKDNFFTPVYKVITVGESVTWVNEGSDRHTVTSYDDAPIPFDSSPRVEATCDDNNPLTTEDCMEPGDEFTVEFPQTGTWEYRCKVHGNGLLRPDNDASAQEQPCGMCGIIRVVEEASNPRSDRRDPKPSPRKESPRRTRSPTASPSASIDASPSDRPVASAADDGAGQGGRLLLALALLSVLGGAGWFTWKKYLA